MRCLAPVVQRFSHDTMETWLRGSFDAVGRCRDRPSSQPAGANVDGIFAGGDYITGPTTVISAIASGRRAAIAIDKYLTGVKGPIRIIDEKTQFHEPAGLALDGETTEERPRIEIEIENPVTRTRDFREVEKGFTEDQARVEAGRCLRCDLEER